MSDTERAFAIASLPLQFDILRALQGAPPLVIVFTASIVLPLINEWRLNSKVFCRGGIVARIVIGQYYGGILKHGHETGVSGTHACGGVGN